MNDNTLAIRLAEIRAIKLLSDILSAPPRKWGVCEEDPNRAFTLLFDRLYTSYETGKHAKVLWSVVAPDNPNILTLHILDQKDNINPVPFITLSKSTVVMWHNQSKT